MENTIQTRLGWFAKKNISSRNHNQALESLTRSFALKKPSDQPFLLVLLADFEDVYGNVAEDRLCAISR